MHKNRLPGDPSYSVKLDDPAHVTVQVGGEAITMSVFNARRVLGSLSLILELPLTKAAAKQIKMGGLRS
jgi:hypothetical protein